MLLALDVVLIAAHRIAPDPFKLTASLSLALIQLALVVIALAAPRRRSSA